jgi:site-specific DNA-methyltransferase (adenine-specific)
LRDYGTPGQLGLEKTPEEYVANMVAVFREVRRVLKGDGVVFLNLGDSYAGGGGFSPNAPSNVAGAKQTTQRGAKEGGIKPQGVIKQKDLVGIPWRVAFALQADGWYLRSDIIWSKPNPMPESVTDRPTKAHEYIFLMSKSAKYYYDNDAIREPQITAHLQKHNSPIKDRGEQKQYNKQGLHDFINPLGKNRLSVWDIPAGEETPPPNPSNKQDALGKPTYTGFNARYKARKPAGWNTAEGSHGSFHPDGRAQKVEYGEIGERRNKRTVWSIATQPYAGFHFATFPEEIPRLCILAGSRPGDVILDPFGGSGTTSKVALELGRKPVHIDIGYHKLARQRMTTTPAMAGLMA